MAIYNLCILKIQNRCTTQNPSIIIINTMEIKLAKTIEQYLVRLIKEELQFVSTPYNQLKSLAEEIYQNMVTGLLLIEKEVYTVLKLLHTLTSKPESFEIEQVSALELLIWVQKDEIRDYLLAFITEKLIVYSEMESIGKDYQDSDCYIIQDPALEKKSIGLENVQKTVQKQQQKDKICKDQALAVGQQLKSTSDKYQDQKCQNNQEYENFQNQIFNDYEAVYDDISEYLQKREQNLPSEFDQIDEKPQFISPQPNQNQNAIQQNQNDSKLPFDADSPHICPNSERKYSFDSINASNSSQQYIKTLKLTDARGPKQDEQVVSEVSSFNNQQSFASASIYTVQDTSRYGHLLYGDKIDKILRSFVSKSSIFLLVRWKVRSNGYQPIESLLESVTLREHSPQQLIQFYKSMDN